MPTTVNCQCYRQGKCYHHAAPRGFFRHTQCILLGHPDPRIKACALQYPYAKPDGYPLPPPSRVIREGSNTEYLWPEKNP